MNKKEKIAFFVMTKKGFSIIEHIVKIGKLSLVDTVIIGKDKKVENDYSHQIEQLCKANEISYSFRKQAPLINAKYAIAISWRWMINLNSTKLIVLHDSLLPKYRGFAPLVNALQNGEEEVGVTALHASEIYDRGEIITQSKLKIKYPITIEELTDMIIGNYIEIITILLNKLENRIELDRIKQNEPEATYSLWLDEEDYMIDWNKDSNYIVRFINSVGKPYKGASSYIGRKKVRILEAEEYPDIVIENRKVGKVILKENDLPIVVCGKGLVKLRKIMDDKKTANLIPFKKLRIKFKNKL